MKCLYILISFALVNVSVAIDDYVKQAIFLNLQMRFERADLSRIIQNFVLFGEFSMVELALIFSVPEADDGDIKDHIEKEKKFYQEIWQDQKWFYLVPPGAFQLDDVQDDMEKINLDYVGLDRRRFTLPAVQILLHDILSGNNPHFSNFADFCRLLGVYKSIKHPYTFTKWAEGHEEGGCKLTDIKDDFSQYFKNEATEGKVMEYDKISQSLHIFQVQ